MTRTMEHFRVNTRKWWKVPCQWRSRDGIVRRNERHRRFGSCTEYIDIWKSEIVSTRILTRCFCAAVHITSLTSEFCPEHSTTDSRRFQTMTTWVSFAAMKSVPKKKSPAKEKHSIAMQYWVLTPPRSSRLNSSLSHLGTTHLATLLGSLRSNQTISFLDRILTMGIIKSGSKPAGRYGCRRRTKR